MFTKEPKLSKRHCPFCEKVVTAAHIEAVHFPSCHANHTVAMKHHAQYGGIADGPRPCRHEHHPDPLNPAGHVDGFVRLFPHPEFWKLSDEHAPSCRLFKANP